MKEPDLIDNQSLPRFVQYQYRDSFFCRNTEEETVLQVDIELSFTHREGIIDLIERLLNASWPNYLPEIQRPFKKITYKGNLWMSNVDEVLIFLFEFRMHGWLRLWQARLADNLQNPGCYIPIQRN